jgi:hypothetical protein
MPDIFVSDNFYMPTSDACVIDLTPPTFAGVNFLDVESRGQIRAGWAAATDANAPIRYEVYIQANTPTGLFNLANITGITDKLQYDIFTLPNGSFLVNGTTYYVGVRALDGLSNRDANTVSLNVISTGVLTSIDVYENKCAWSISSDNLFHITMWSNKNESLAIAPGAVMGSATFQVFDKAGVAVVGMSGTVLSPNASGLYVATPVANLIDPDRINDHYTIRLTISVDGENRVNFIPVNDEVEGIDIDGAFSLNNSNNIIGSLWAEKNAKIVTTNLGTASYQFYNADGSVVAGVNQSGIAADVNGYFVITPFALPSSIDLSKSYIIRATVTVNGIARTKNIVLNGDLAEYTTKAVFSINAGNQLEATFWATKNDQIAPTSILGTASYTVYDKNGVAVAGLTQSGIVADVNGLYHTTPVSAILLTDLTHYTATITISVAGTTITAIKGFTLLGN